jgi:glycosyltransferase involved in cell wall biosynthesis
MLVRLKGIPVGYALLSSMRLTALDLAAQLWAQLGSGINELVRELGGDELDALPADGISIDTPADTVATPFISVVICTRDRPEGALRTLESVMAVEYPHFEVILVDNAPSDERTFDAVAHAFENEPMVRYVRELRPGLSCARNRGLLEAKSSIVAFTDDDVNIDPLWLRGIARGFARAEGVGCVTGMVPSAQLETPSQLYFDQRYTWGSRCKPRVFDLTANRGETSLYPYAAGLFGTGANFAVDRDVADSLGGFDEALGAGTQSGGGEDLDMFVRTILAGHRLVYEPSAIITHIHRADVTDLDRQLFNYGSGLTAFLTKQLLDPGRAVDLLSRIPRGVQHMTRSTHKARSARLLPRSVTRREFYGMVAGPWRYIKGKRLKLTSPAVHPMDKGGIGRSASSDEEEPQQPRVSRAAGSLRARCLNVLSKAVDHARGGTMKIPFTSGGPARKAESMKAPIFIGELELTEPINGISLPIREDGLAYSSVRLLVRMQLMPVGYAFLGLDSLDASSIGREIWSQLSSVINARRSCHGLTTIDTLPVEGIASDERLADKITAHPLVTVVVCTRDRPEGAVATLRGLASLHYEPFEVVLVDNAPSTDLTEMAVHAEFADDPRVHYVREPRRGLSCARNRGVAEAAGDIVAFTDDDVAIDPWWLHGIVRGFQRAADVVCVTGLIPTAEIENAAQLYFDCRESWGTFCERRIFDVTDNRDNSLLYPYSAGVFGAGANFAMARSALKKIGRFDEALGAGSPCGGGEDLDMFMRIILAGHRLVYEPSAIVSHIHRAELSALSKQMRAYGSGLTAALTATVTKSSQARLELPPKIVMGVIRIFRMSDQVRGNPTLPSGLMAREIGGMFLGPWLYFKGRRNLRRSTRYRL